MNIQTDEIALLELGGGWRRPFGWQARIQQTVRRSTVLEDIELVGAWCRQLVVEIGMHAYGPPIVARFGEGDRLGVTAVQRMVVQRLTTSAIVVHADPPDGLFVDVFSCQRFDPRTVADSAARFFEATAGTGDFVQRQCPAPGSGFRYAFD